MAFVGRRKLNAVKFFPIFYIVYKMKYNIAYKSQES